MVFYAYKQGPIFRDIQLSCRTENSKNSPKSPGPPPPYNQFHFYLICGDIM